MGSAAGSVVDRVSGSDIDIAPKWNWDTFWNSDTKSLDEDTKNTLSEIGTAISDIAPKILSGISNDKDVWEKITSNVEDEKKIVEIKTFNKEVYWNIPADYYDNNHDRLTISGVNVAVDFGIRDEYTVAYVSDGDGNCDALMK